MYTHLLFNMLCLWWFGSDMEQLYGRREFLAIYLTSAFLSGCAYEAWNLCWGNFDARCLGAFVQLAPIDRTTEHSLPHSDRPFVALLDARALQ